MKRDKKFAVVNGTAAEKINQKEVDTMAEMSAAQTADVAPAEVQQPAATPEKVAEPEKVGFFTKVKTGIQNTGKKLWDNRGKIGLVVGAVGTVATAVVIDRIRNGEPQPEMAVPEYDVPDSDEQSETSETTENTEES